MSHEAKSWPDLVGKDANEAEKQIKAEGRENVLMQRMTIYKVVYLGYNPEIKPEGAPCTRDYRINRVRLFVDGSNKIVQAPHTG